VNTASSISGEWHNAQRAWLRISRRLVHWLEQPLVSAMMRRSAVDDVLSALHPLLSLSEVRARVVSVKVETFDTKTLMLQPNSHWQGARSGQFVRVQVEIQGKRHERAYSLSSAEGTGTLAITVKRQGLVSQYLHDNVKPGAVLTISQASGTFTLPNEDQQPLPERILLLSAGSGITPVMAILRSLHAQHYMGDVVFVHMCSNESDLIFSAELKRLQGQMPRLTLATHFSQIHGRLEPSRLRAIVPDLEHRSTWMCGPGAWMDRMHDYWQTELPAAALHSERFGSPPRMMVAVGDPAEISCTTSGRTFTAAGGDTLLVQAERAGLAPKHGCRMGICASCQCVKASGSVQNLVTGEVSSAANETIRLCISAARSDVTLAL